MKCVKSPNRQIAKSPNRQIAKSPNRQIAKSPNRQIASHNFAIDKKADDAMPATGKIRAYLWTICTDAADENDLTSDYDLANDDIACAMLYLL